MVPTIYGVLDIFLYQSVLMKVLLFRTTACRSATETSAKFHSLVLITTVPETTGPVLRVENRQHRRLGARRQQAVILPAAIVGESEKNEFIQIFGFFLMWAPNAPRDTHVPMTEHVPTWRLTP